MVETAHHFSIFFPGDFADRILPKNILPLELEVYRVCTCGKLCRDAFLSTYEEVQLQLKPAPYRWKNKEPTNPSDYSTSCDSDYDNILGTMDCLKGYHPKAILARGIASYKDGPVQRSKDRWGEEQREKAQREGKDNTHIDWWIYREADPSGRFEEVSIEENNDG